MCFLNLFRRKKDKTPGLAMFSDEYVVPQLAPRTIPETESLKRRKAEEELIAMFNIHVEKTGTAIGVPSADTQ